MPTGARLLLALTVAVISGSACTYRLAQRRQMAADFTFSWAAARYLAEGMNPYQAIRPEGEYPNQTYFYYPLTAALAALPFAPLPPVAAGALFFALSSGLLAYAVGRAGCTYLPLFLSAPYWVALGVAQWSPLLAAAALLPGLGWLLACKPNIGLAGFLYRPHRGALVGMAIFGVVSLLVLPRWPFDWLKIIQTLEGHPPPVLVLPLGPLLFLAVLRIRWARGRLLLALALLPQLLFFYDQLLLWFIPRSFFGGLFLSALSWVAYFGWKLTGVDPANGEILAQPTAFIVALIFLPALVMLFIRPKN